MHLLPKADGKRISITGAFPEAQIDGFWCFFFKKLTAQKPCRRVFEGAAGFYRSRSSLFLFPDLYLAYSRRSSSTETLTEMPPAQPTYYSS